MTAGVTAAGFVKKTLSEIKAEIEADELSTIDPTLILAADQPIGQINSIYSKKLAELWELVEVAYSAFDRGASEGRLLDNVGSLTGTPRDPSKKSYVTCTLTLGAGFSQAPGTMMANVAGQPAIQFINKAAVTSVGAGSYSAVFEATVYGATSANASTLTHITNPITGWTAITNPLDAVLGTLTEEDSPYRERQEAELSAAGACTVDAIRADLLKVEGVQQAFVYENVTLVTDGTGLPGKAFEGVIYDGAAPAALDVDIAQAIWNSKPSGSETYGTGSANATDATGTIKNVKFSRCTPKNIYLELDIKVDTSKYPLTGTADVKTKVVAEGNALNLGDDVVALDLRACVLEKLGGVAGVTDVTAIRLGFSASPVGTTNLVITGRELARFDTSHVVVTLV